MPPVQHGWASMTDEEIQTAERILGYEFSDRELLKRALTHASLVDSRHGSAHANPCLAGGFEASE